MTVFRRMAEERARLGLTQQDVADQAEVHLKTVQRWEIEIPIPADVLGQLTPLGFDVQYVVGGIRSTNADDVREAAGSSALDAALSPEEWALLRRYRALGDAARAQVDRMIDVIAMGIATESRGTTVIATGKGARVAGRDYKPRKR